MACLAFYTDIAFILLCVWLALVGSKRKQRMWYCRGHTNIFNWHPNKHFLLVYYFECKNTAFTCLDSTAHIKHAKKKIIIIIKMAGNIQPHRKYLKLKFRQATNYRAEMTIWVLFYLLIDFVFYSASFVILAAPARQDHHHTACQCSQMEHVQCSSDWHPLQGPNTSSLTAAAL